MNNRGITFTELMISLAIFIAMVAGIYSLLNAGRDTWLTTDTQIDLQENLRKTMLRVSKELRESGSDSTGTMQVIISDNTGVNSSDILSFSVPIICEVGGNIIDVNGDVANWGAPLTWGCTSSTCMDADDDCSTTDYSSLQYRIDNNNQLVRRVLDSADALVREDVFAQNITDFQVSLSADQNVVTLVVDASKNSSTNRPISASSSLDVYLRNRG